MSRTIVFHLVVLLISTVIIWWLYRWTMLAFYPPPLEMDASLAKPWRAWARLAFSAVITGLLLGTHILVARRTRFL